MLEEFKMELVMDVALEGVVDKEVNKQVEEFNMELVLDVAVEGVVNNEMTKVVEEVNKELVKEVNEGLLLVCRCGDVVLKRKLTWRSTRRVTRMWPMLSTSFLTSEQFQGPYGNSNLRKAFCM